MLTNPTEILKAFPQRKTQKERLAFRDVVQSYSAYLGYETGREQKWLTIGNVQSAAYLLTAGRSDSALLTLLEILRTLPENRRSRAAFVLFDDGMLSLRSYCKRHPETENQLVIHLDNVAQGDKLRMFPTKQLNADRRKLTSLYKACGYFGRKSLLVQEENCLPRYVPFSNGAVICAVPGDRKENYRNRNRTEKALVVDQTNINILRAGLISFITCTD